MNKPEYIYMTCCLCEQPIDPAGWYSSYSDTHKAHSECWQRNKEVNHSIRLQASKLELMYEEPQFLFI